MGTAQPRYRAYIACWVASQAMALEGDFVECGVNRGAFAMSIMEYTRFSDSVKRFYLLDTSRDFRLSNITLWQSTRPEEIYRQLRICADCL
jgi:hypothetical protein